MKRRRPKTRLGEAHSAAELADASSERSVESLRHSADARRIVDADDCSAAVRRLLRASEAKGAADALAGEARAADAGADPKYLERAGEELHRASEHVLEACAAPRKVHR